MAQAIQAVLLDALGTLVHFEPPAPLLRAALRERHGIEVSEEAAEAAVRAEIAYYRAHLDEGRDADSVADLRRRAAEVMRPALGVGAPTGVLTDALLAALRFHAYPDAAPALRALRELGLRLVVVSNWDHSLHERLEETGLAPLVDGAVASAEVGSPKPARAIFDRALELAGAPAGAALHAGDSPEADAAGALAAGLQRRARGPRRRASGAARRAGDRVAGRAPGGSANTLRKPDDERPALFPAPGSASGAARAAGRRACPRDAARGRPPDRRCPGLGALRGRPGRVRRRPRGRDLRRHRDRDRRRRHRATWTTPTA